MTLRDGQSAIDSVTLRLPDQGKEITNWSRYSYNHNFLTPTTGWSFSLSDEDTELTNSLLAPGARVELEINGKIQCSGSIDKKTVETSATGGTTVTVQGRDILGKVVDSCVDPVFKFTAGATLIDVLLAVLSQFGITKVYNSDALNIGVISGLPRNSATSSTQTVQVQVPQRVPQPDGTVKLEYTTQAGTVTIDRSRPDLKKVTLDQIKPRLGEGAYAYLDRILRRFGFQMWAAADGSGVIVDKADFTTQPSQRIVHKRGTPESNNVLFGKVDLDLSTQPSVIIAFGTGGGREATKSSLKVIMVNELVGLDALGNPLPEIENIKVRYKGAKLLPIRKEIIPFTRPPGDRKLASPMFLKDDESKNIAQLEAFVRREMAIRQQRGFQASYELIGHTEKSNPWAVNTLVKVEDEVLDINENLWILDKTFTKSVGGGTTTSLKLIKPFTYQIAV